MAGDEENGTSPREAETGHGVHEVGRDDIHPGRDYNRANRDNINAGRDNNSAARDFNLTNIINNNYRANESEEDTRDPTDDFPNSLFDNFIPFLNESEIEEYASILRRRRILLINSPAANCSLDAALSLIRHRDFQSYRYRLLQFDSHDGRFKHDRLYKVSTGKDGKALVMAEIAADEVVALLPRMSSGIESLRQILEKANLCLMVVVSATGGAIPISTDCPVEIWNVDLLQFLLRRAEGGSPAETDELIEKIREQRKKQRWPRDDAKFYVQIRTLLSNGWNYFTQEVRQDTATANAQSHTATVLKTAEDRFEEVLEKADKDRPLYLAALYVACYFYEARPGDFNLLVNLLLDKAAAKGDELSGVTTADWRDRSDAILRKLNIGIRRTSAGHEVLGFNAPEDVSTARVFFEQRRPMFRERQFERLMAADLIFQDALSLTGMERAVRLLCNMMLADPNRRAGLMNALLDGLVAHPEKWVAQSQGRLAAKCASLFDRATGTQNFFSELGQLFRPRRAGKEPSIVMRVSYLFVSLERTPELQPLAWQLLDRLEENGHQALICDLLLQAATDARFQPSEAFWRRLRHGLEGGTNLDRDRYYRFLAQYMEQLGQDVFEVLSVVYWWLPDPKVKEGVLSQPEKVALMCLHDFNLFQLSRIGRDSIGVWPPSHPLLAAMADGEDCLGGRDGDTASKRRKIVVEWVFHPAWTRLDQPLAPIWSAANEVGIGEANRNLMAALFIHWMILLAGSMKNKADDNSIALARALLETAFDSFDRERKRWFRDRLYKFRNDLLQRRGQEIADRDLRQWYDVQRKAINFAIEDWSGFGAR